MWLPFHNDCNKSKRPLKQSYNIRHCEHKTMQKVTRIQNGQGIQRSKRKQKAALCSKNAEGFAGPGHQ